MASLRPITELKIPMQSMQQLCGEDLETASCDTLLFCLASGSFARLLLVPDSSEQYLPRQEHAHALLVEFVLGIFARADLFCQRCASLEHGQIRNDPADGPVPPDVVRGNATPRVEQHPNGLFGGEVGVSAVFPQSRCDKATI